MVFQVIGSGQFGEVWVGMIKDQRVAIKTNKEDNMLAVTEFFYEGEIMVNFNHDHIVKVTHCQTRREKEREMSRKTNEISRKKLSDRERKRKEHKKTSDGEREREKKAREEQSDGEKERWCKDCC